MIYLLPTNTCFWIWCPITEIADYHKIYKIKKRSFDKPLAILVEDFNWLRNNTQLTDEQVDFLEKYDKPFTILTESSYLSAWINFVDENNNEFINRDEYSQIAFRVAHNNTQSKLIKQNGPLFLTSANFSGKPEMQNAKEVRKEFEYYLDKGIVQFVWENTGVINSKYTSSDIFEFIWEGLEIEYLRKND